jgi:hypothetical protein
MTFVDCEYAGGAGAGEAGLTWAQSFMWEVIAAAGVEPAQFDFLLVREPADPVPLDAAVEFLRGFLLRHPVLRTGIAVTPGGAPVQHVRAAGTVRVPVLGDPSPGSLRAAVPGTTAAEPCRPLLVASGGRVSRIAVRISHLATDRGGIQLLADDLIRSPIGPGAADGPATTPSPVDLARFENSAAGLAVERRATDFAAERYATCPPTMWPRPRRRPERARFWYGELWSARLLTAMDSLARERRLSLAGVLTGGIAAVAAASAGLRSALLFTISGNRIDPAWRGYPGQLSQEAILHVPIGETIAETTRAATAETMRSLQVARYGPAAMRAVCRAAERDRGVCFDKLGSALVLNLMTGEPAGGGHGGNADTSAPPAFAWTGSTDRENLGCYIDAYRKGAGFVLGVRVDTELMAPDEAAAWLHAVEWTVVSGAARDVTFADVRARLAPAGRA